VYSDPYFLGNLAHGCVTLLSMRDEEESRDQEPEHTRFYRLDHSWSFDGEEVVYGTGPPKNDANAESDLDAATRRGSQHRDRLAIAARRLAGQPPGAQVGGCVAQSEDQQLPDSSFSRTSSAVRLIDRGL